MPHSSSSFPLGRAAAIAALAVAMFGASACGWFRKDAQMYRLSAENRPLEVPPDLDMPSTAGAIAPPAEPQPSVMRSSLSAPAPAGTSAAAAASAGTGFTVGGDSDQMFVRVGEALAATEGLTIASTAQLLGVYDVSYMGSNFLVRVTAVEAGTYISAIDPRGLPATGEGPAQLLASLQAALQ